MQCLGLDEFTASATGKDCLDQRGTTSSCATDKGVRPSTSTVSAVQVRGTVAMARNAKRFVISASTLALALAFVLPASARLATNRLASNRLASNKLSSNKLSANRLAGNG